MQSMSKTAFILFVYLVITLTEAYEESNVTVYPETFSNMSSTGILDQGLQPWEHPYGINQSGVLENEFHDTIWEESSGNEYNILYDIYSTQPNLIPETDEDGLEVSDDWLILDTDDDEAWMGNVIEDSIEGGSEELIMDEEPNPEVLDCDQDIPVEIKRKRKISPKKRENDEFYFKHKQHGKKAEKKGRKKKPNWKKNCCIRGKRVGNSRRTFLSNNLFQECRERTRNLASRMSRPCKWIFWSCCEARALRRYYIHYKPAKSEVC